MKAQAFICKSQPLLKRERIGGFQGPKVRRVFTISCSKRGKSSKTLEGEKSFQGQERESCGEERDIWRDRPRVKALTRPVRKDLVCLSLERVK